MTQPTAHGLGTPGRFPSDGDCRRVTVRCPESVDLFGERLSCHGFASNEVRLLLASFAQLLLERLRSIGLAGTALASATAGTIRLQLLKLAAHVTVSVRRVHVRLASAFARQAVFAQAHAQLVAWADPG